MSTAVTTLVFTPQTKCAFNHSRFWVFLPCLWSYQRTNLDVLNPEESTAKSVSTALSGGLLTVTNSQRIGLSMGFAM